MILGREDDYTNLTKEGNFKLHEVLDSEDKYQPSLQQVVNAIQLAQRLEVLRKSIGSIDINSWFRSTWWNQKVNGTITSFHLQGLAADIKFDFKPWTRYSLTKLFESIGFTNVNFYWNANHTSWVWIHVDIGKPWNGKEFYYRDMDAVTQKEITL